MGEENDDAQHALSHVFEDGMHKGFEISQKVIAHMILSQHRWWHRFTPCPCVSTVRMILSGNFQTHVHGHEPPDEPIAFDDVIGAE